MRSVALILSLGMAVVALAQTKTQQPRIEVATIKPAKPGGLQWAWCRGTDSSELSSGWIASRVLPGSQVPPRPGLGRCLMSGVTVKMIIGMAYLTFPYKIDEEIAGGPKWAGSDRFDIETKAENPAVTEAQLSEMLQQLLADRFNLTFHRESKEVSGYALVIAKNGLKLQAVKDPEARTLVGGNPAGV